MNVDLVQKTCLRFPMVTEQVQWGDNLVFKVGGRMFAIASLKPAAVWLSFKCSPEVYWELLERPGIVPAPYLARAKWVALETQEAILSAELVELLRSAYELIAAKLPKTGRGKKRSSAARVRQRKNDPQKSSRKRK